VRNRLALLLSGGDSTLRNGLMGGRMGTRVLRDDDLPKVFVTAIHSHFGARGLCFGYWRSGATSKTMS